MGIRRIAIYLGIVVLICCALPLNVFAISSNTITDIIAPFDKNVQHDTTSVRPESVIEYPLTADMFSWSGSPGNAGEPVTRAQLRNSNIAVKYTSSQSKVLKEVSLSTTSYNGSQTVCVKLEFAEEFVSVKPLDFKLTMYLTMGGTRKEASVVTMYGEFENEEIEIDSSYDYISLSDGQVLSSSDYISNLKIDLGADVQIFTSIQKDTKYYAAAKNTFTDADDNIIKKYPEIETAIHIKSVNLRPTSNCVSMKDIGTFYVYSGTGKYLGTTADRLPFYETYYLTSKKINMDAQATFEGGNNSAGSNVGAISGNTPEESAAQKEMGKAANDALTSGSTTASVSVKDVEKISSGELQAMFDAAALAKMKARYIADTTSTFGSKVQGRIEINPALAVKLNSDILLGVYTSGSAVNKTTAFFEKYYSNQLRVVHLSQEGSYGMTVKISVRIDKTSKSNLYFYAYDHKNNSYQQLVAPNSFIDKNGYLHFSTIYGGNIIISEGPLLKR